ncbi:hypothetical protein I2W78_27215 [Streptomyces spinoverrucosus]|uniref:hypothetical protein n=1 Tax=Streptomyces spinoverrucosus TaxID=284043 RepID=UPI0018C4030F|nr:hypothetical protein [Streptomyces spinoverrucosus]MBG0855433.1 hypothetical protein [Streptomyces spinoverrucosus]
MTRLRTALVTAVTTALFLAPAAVTAASAAPFDEDDPTPLVGCATLTGSGAGWAAIYNECGHGIYASVEVDGFDPSCVYIDPYTTEYIGLEEGDVPYYAYEC